MICDDGRNCGHEEDVNSIECYYHKIATSTDNEDIGVY